MSLDTDTTQPSELDDCTVWILQHNETFYNTGIPDHRQIEWLENCIGQQRYVKKENHRKKWNILFIWTNPFGFLNINLPLEIQNKLRRLYLSNCVKKGGGEIYN